MINPIHVFEGATNSIFGINQEISKRRFSICLQCPIFSRKFGGMCNNKLWLDPNTGDVSFQKKNGYKQGCGCKLSFKTSVSDEECPAGKW